MVTIVRREIRKRGFFGAMFKWLFIIFNVLMAIWLFSYWGKISPMVSNGNEYARAGAAIGATAGTGMIFFFWTAGAVILGLITILTRGPVTIIEERQE